MPYMKEHVDAGIITSGAVSSIIFIGYLGGIVPTLHDLFVLVLFGSIGIIIGSDLPDIDSRTAPIHFFFGVLTFVTVTILSLAYFKLGNLSSLFFGFISTGAYIKLMPRHRGFIHTIRAGMILAGIGGLLMQILFHDLYLSVWLGFSIFVGHMVHLLKDGWVRL